MNGPRPRIGSPRATSPFPRTHSPLPTTHNPYARSQSVAPGVGSARHTPLQRPHSTPGFLDTFTGGSYNCTDDETLPLLGGEDVVVAVYTRRWYLLLLISLVALLQTMQWATWGPISESALVAFGWDDSVIAMSVWMGNVPFAALCIPLAWLMDYKGLRLAVLVTVAVMALGAGIRCLIYFAPSSYAMWLMFAGQLLNGMGGPVAQGGQALFSTLWFPPNQRTTATAIATFVGYMGSATAFVLGPHMVPGPSSIPPSNGSIVPPNPSGQDASAVKLLYLVDAANTTGTDGAAQRNGIMTYLYLQALASAGLLVLVLVYFPDKPPQPPSVSAALEREEFIPGLKLLVRNKQFWLISAAFCLSLGVFEVWDVILDVNLSAINISQDTAGWLGFYCIIAGCLTGLVICRLADIFFRQIRLFLILSYVVSAIFLLWFILIYINILPFDMVSIYAAIILSGVFLDGSSPLVYELICEAAYPVGEGVACSFLQMLFTLAGILFTSVQQIPNIGTVWMNWCLLICICLAVPMLAFTKDTFSRSDLDNMDIVVQPPINTTTTTPQSHLKAAFSDDDATDSLLPDLLSDVYYNDGVQQTVRRNADVIHQPSHATPFV